MSSERTQYASSILVSQEPIDATEIVRVRLSQAKLLNDEFADFFKKYYSIKAQYLNDLTRLVQHSENLNKNIEQKIIENQVLTREELKYYNVDAIGNLSEIWNKVISEIKDEISANNLLKNVVHQEVVGPLTTYTAKNKQWSDVRSLHSKLSDIAQSIEYNQDKLGKHEDSRHPEKLEKYRAALASANSSWDSEAPYIFEAFEHTDFARLNFLRDSLLKFITAYTDSLNKISQSNERTLETILNFNPDKEIARFAKVSAETKYVPKEARKAAESPKVNKKHSFINQATHSEPSTTAINHSSASRNFSTATETSVATSGAKSEKRNKLKSRVGSIFGRKKDKKKVNVDESLAESDGASSDIQSANRNRQSRTSSFASGFETRGQRASQLNSTTSEEHGALKHPYGAPQPISKSQTLPVNIGAPASGGYNGSFASIPALQPTIKGQPHSLENSSEPRTSEASYSDGSSNINVSQQNVEPDFNGNGHAGSQQSQQSEQKQHPTLSQLPQPSQQYQSSPESHQHRVPPPPPASRKTHFPQGLDNIREDGDYHAPERSQSQQSTTGQHSNRRDIQSGLFTNLNIANTEVQNRRISSYNSFSNESIRQLNPQTTGSSLSGQSALFQHPVLNQPGLNASVAEVVNAKFKDGEQVQSQFIGEIAFSYQTNGEALPTRTNLKIHSKVPFDKVIPNTQILKQVDAEEFEINPHPILSRTLGGLKYLIKSAPAPVIILPAWRFEPHQASVMLNIKLAPHITALLPEGQSLSLKDLIVSVSINGTATSALSKPSGSFNKDKARITWRFSEHVTLSSNSEEKLVARFITETQASEYEQGVSAKFTIDSENNGINFTNTVGLESQNFSEDDPFAQETWKPVSSHFALVAGNYSGL